MNKDWDSGYREISIPRESSDGSWDIENVRDFSYAPTIVTNAEWKTVSVHASDVARGWFYVASLPQFGPFKSLFAHTFIGFEWQDGERLGLSVEARRHEDEPYDPFIRGMFGAYEMTYLWGTLDDFESRRLVFQEQTLERYPLTVTHEKLAALFIAACKNTSRTIEKPERYSTITNQCTNALMRLFNMEEGQPIVPWHIHWHLTGLSPRLLATHGLVDLSKKETLR